MNGPQLVKVKPNLSLLALAGLLLLGSACTRGTAKGSGYGPGLSRQAIILGTEPQKRGENRTGFPSAACPPEVLPREVAVNAVAHPAQCPSPPRHAPGAQVSAVHN